MRMSEKYPFSLKVIDYGDGTFEYEVLFDDFPEVIGVGDTASEAIEEAYYNLDAYLKYCEEKQIAIPAPSKKLSLNDYSGKITVRIPKTLHRDLSDYAKCDGMSLNAIAIEAFRFYLNKESLKAMEENSKITIELIGEATKAQTESIIYRYTGDMFSEKRVYQPNLFGFNGGLQYAGQKH